MTATSDFMTSTAKLRTPVCVTDGSRMMMRAAQRLTGAAMLLAAVGLWLAPGAANTEDLLLFKLVLSAAAGLTGMALLQASSKPDAPEVEIDTIRREVRLVRRCNRSDSEVLHRCSFADLSRVEMREPHVALWDAQGALLAEITLSDPKALKSLTAGLRDAGKID